jgi:lipoprotein-anchoring transpeptidase ErfK/SrfK
MLNKYIGFLMLTGASLLSSAVIAYDYNALCNSRNYTCYETRSGRIVAIPRNQGSSYERAMGYNQRGYYGRGARYDDRGGRYHKRSRNHEGTQVSHRALVPPPSKISGGNIVKVDLGNLTWGAYDDGGNLLKYGRVSGGKSYCPDIGRGCRTVQGTFTVYSKKGAGCKSTRFPVGKGGAPMPYCMFFKGGYALHGSNAVPGYNASHGCVRMPPSDAQWLNQNFVRVGSTRVSVHY